jgi:ribosomal protein S18 acetylase RimI-like enzyme
MIQRIEHSTSINARGIRRVFQISYRIEAQLLGAKKFPPLERPITAFQNCTNDFFGFYENEEVVAVIEMKKELKSLHIQSLVVNPNYFRRGIAKNLVEFVLNHYELNLFTVETGKDNRPARKLYESFNFQLVKTYLAAENIMKVRYQKEI